MLPILLLLTMTALDFGRVYLGYINLQNLTRIGANFAANNPTAWSSSDSTALATRTQYGNQILADATASNCTLSPAAPAAPTFSDTNGDGVTTGVGDRASVTYTCSFRVVTPVISAILGGTVNVSSTAVFPVKNGMMASTGSGFVGCQLPVPAINGTPDAGTAPLKVSFTDASGGGAGTGWSWNFGDGTALVTTRDPGDHTFTSPGTYTVNLSVTNVCGTVTTDPGKTITVKAVAAELCTIPDLHNLRFNEAQPSWTAAGFKTTVQQAPGHAQGNFKITYQSVVGASKADCSTTVYVK
jgi:PKD repeat protein